MKINSTALFVCCAAAAIGIAAAQQSSKPQFTARELFYSASQAPKPVASAPVKPPSPPPVQAVPPKRTTTESAVVKTPPKPKKDPALPKESDLHPQSSDQPVRVNAASAVTAATTVSMAPAPSNGTPLGLRYTILKRSGGEMVETAPGTVFHTGDAIQFSVQSNGPGYLYIIAQGSTGTWKPLFPSPDVSEGNNFVDGWRPYSMPPGSRMVFDENKGTEKIFIVFSREPEQDLERTIYMLKNGAGKPSGAQAPKQMVAMNQVNIADNAVGKLRDVYSRDLIIEKVNPATPGERKETAVYVVNPTGSSASHVVADIQLVHE